MLNYDRDALADRRRAVEEENRDVIIWGNDRVIRWAISIGLKVCKMFMIFFLFIWYNGFIAGRTYSNNFISCLGLCK